MGADKGILINAEGLGGLETARLLVEVLKKVPFDLIIAGQRAVDDDHYQVGPTIAEFLKIPMISMVIKENITDGKIRCHRSLEGGSAVLEAQLPLLFTTQRGLNDPRYASLPGIMRAKKKPIDMKTPADFGINPNPPENGGVQIVGIRRPTERGAGKRIVGETEAEKAVELVRLLHQEAKVI